MTRGKVLLIGLAVLLLGGLGQVGFQAAGFEGFSAGIAAEALLVVIVVVWTSSYLFRVVTGQMTYMNQRWHRMGKLERLGIYGLVFLFFPGMILFAPFLNFRLSGQGDV